MDMGLDVAWCLTCSKQTSDPRNPYCSEACRAQDSQSSIPSSSSMPITAPVPPSFPDFGSSCSSDRRSSFSRRMSSHKASVTPRASSPARKASIAMTPARPALAPLPPSSSSSANKGTDARTVPRDRRAFSFPAAQSSPPPPISIARRRDSKLQQPMALSFVRKTMGVSLTSTPAMNSPVKEGPTGTLRAPNKQSNARAALLRPSKSTGGANTPLDPLDPDSVFCSTSESEEDMASPALQLLSGPSVTQQSTVPTSASLSRKSTKSNKSQLGPSAKTSPLIVRDYMLRKDSQSPVAQLVASSASSRSREDIISWAKAVGLRPSMGDTSEEGEDEERGRSRTRRTEALPSLSALPDDLPLPEDQTGTTPKGTIGSALAGLGFTSGKLSKSSKSPQPAPVSSSLGLQSVPAPTHVSNVEVLTSSAAISTSNPNDSDVPYHYGGATPTLSTISLSEAVEPSVNGTFDPAEIVTDDAQSNASHARRPSAPKVLKQASAKQVPLPLRPITTTATAIWNLSTYIRSFSPFSISSVISPYAPSVPRDHAGKHGSGLVTPAPIPEETAEEAAGAQEVLASSPVPASRAESPSQPSPKALVRSLPMDIMLPRGDEAAQALREKIEGRGSRSRPRFRSRSPSRSRSRSRGRATSRHGRSPSRSTSSPKRHGRKLSYDADASDDEDDQDERRGRSRRGKALPRELPDRRSSDQGPPGVLPRRLSEGGMRVLGERSGSRGAGRRR